MIHTEFSTQDIVLAATLKAAGYALSRIDKDGNKGIFCFTDVSSDIIMKFDLRQITVEPIDFNNCIKSLTTAARRIL